MKTDSGYADCASTLIYIYERISSNSHESSDLPLTEWHNILINEGFELQGLANFFCSDDFVRTWQGPGNPGNFYSQSILEALTTADFIEKLCLEQSQYMHEVLKAVEIKITERDVLMNTAGGLKHPVGAAIGISLSGAIVITCIVLYVKRDAVANSFRNWRNKEVAQIRENFHQELTAKADEATRKGQELLLNHNPGVPLKEIDRILSQQNIPIKSAGEGALMSISHSNPALIETIGNQMRRKVVRDELLIHENPEAFLDKAININPANFRLDRKGFEADIDEKMDYELTIFWDSNRRGMDKVMKAMIGREFGGLILQNEDAVEDKINDIITENTVRIAKTGISNQFRSLLAHSELVRLDAMILKEDRLLAKLSDPQIINNMLAKGYTIEEINQELVNHQGELAKLTANHQKQTKIIDKALNDLRPTEQSELKRAFEDTNSLLRLSFDYWRQEQTTKQVENKIKEKAWDKLKNDNEFEAWKEQQLVAIEHYYGVEVAAAAKKRFHLNAVEDIEEEALDRLTHEVDISIEDEIEPEIEQQAAKAIKKTIISTTEEFDAYIDQGYNIIEDHF
jgi:hypothetical protein